MLIKYNWAIETRPDHRGISKVAQHNRIVRSIIGERLCAVFSHNLTPLVQALQLSLLALLLRLRINVLNGAINMDIR